MAAAEKLGTTQAAISHYLYSKRGDKRMQQLESIPSVQSAASDVALGIVTKKFSMTEAMLMFCKLCTILRRQDFICDLHRGFASLPEKCSACL